MQDDERMTEWRFDAECTDLAQDIFDEMLANMADDETPDQYRDDMMDRAHEKADGHQWVIYHYWAHNVCANVNTDQGEQFLEDVGNPDPVTYDSLATTIVYGEMRARIEQALETLINDYDPDEVAA